MPPPEGYTKAELQIEGGDTIQALFNPTELSITKGNNWTFDPVKGTSLPKGKFGGGKPREMQVSLLLDQTLPNGGKTVKEIADKLSLSVKTISTYLARILEKMKMKNNAELTHYVIREGLID
jgi:DNA-binding NarL/FixJ family response regulator